MKILRVAEKIFPDATGGSPYHVHALSRDQANLGHDVTVLTIKSEDGQPEEEHRGGYTVIRKPLTASVLRNGISVGIARYLQKTEQYDLIHAHSHLRFSTFMAAINRQLDSTPFVITNHGLESQSVPHWVSQLYLKTMGRFTLNSGDLIFCYTEEEKESLRKLGVSTEVRVVSNGINVERFRPCGNTYYDIDDSNPVVIFVGRLFRGKRPRDAIDAVSRVKDQIPKIRLYICGDGPLRRELEEYTRHEGLIDHVSFLGAVGYEIMPEIYRASDILILPSATEGFPRVVLESLATETPVITSDLDQISPIVNQAGRSIEVGNIAGYRDAILELIEDENKRRNLGRRGREIIETDYSWSSTVKQTTSFCEMMINDNPNE